MDIVIDIQLKEVQSQLKNVTNERDTLCSNLSLVTVERDALHEQLEQTEGKFSAVCVKLKEVEEENRLLLSQARALKAGKSKNGASASSSLTLWRPKMKEVWRSFFLWFVRWMQRKMATTYYTVGNEFRANFDYCNFVFQRRNKFYF